VCHGLLLNRYPRSVNESGRLHNSGGALLTQK
jgi:hypothetical protein